MALLNTEGPDHLTEMEGPFTLKDVKPQTVVCSTPLQNRVFVSKVDARGTCTVRNGKDHRLQHLSVTDLTMGKPNEQYKTRPYVAATMNNFGNQQTHTRAKQAKIYIVYHLH